MLCFHLQYLNATPKGEHNETVKAAVNVVCFAVSNPPPYSLFYHTCTTPFPLSEAALFAFLFFERFSQLKLILFGSTSRHHEHWN